MVYSEFMFEKLIIKKRRLPTYWSCALKEHLHHTTMEGKMTQEPLVLTVGEEVPDAYRRYLHLRYCPVEWRDRENNVVQIMSQAWMAQVDLLYYREMFKSRRAYLYNSAPPNQRAYVQDAFNAMQDTMDSEELDRMTEEELSALVERVWVPFWDDIFAHVRIF